jgi:hypothetical protein
MCTTQVISKIPHGGNRKVFTKTTDAKSKTKGNPGMLDQSEMGDFIESEY